MYNFVCTDGKTRLVVNHAPNESEAVERAAKCSLFPRGVGIWCDGIAFHTDMGVDVLDLRSIFGGLRLIPQH
jgi:hypothetical protein